jgi:hypothetical protein
MGNAAPQRKARLMPQGQGYGNGNLTVSLNATTLNETTRRIFRMARATASRDGADKINATENDGSTDWKSALQAVFGVWRDHGELDKITVEERRKLVERMSRVDGG